MLGSSRLGFVFLLSVVDCGNSGPSLSLQSWAQLGFLPSVVDFCSVGPVALVRSFARPALAVSILDFAAAGFSFFLRQPACVGSALSVAGLARVGFVSSLFVIDCGHLDFSTSLRRHFGTGDTGDTR